MNVFNAVVITTIPHTVNANSINNHLKVQKLRNTLKDKVMLVIFIMK